VTVEKVAASATGAGIVEVVVLVIVNIKATMVAEQARTSPGSCQVP
jgi:hypothetical protein